MDRVAGGNRTRGTLVLALLGAGLLAGCDESGAFPFGPAGAERTQGDGGRSVRLVERDVEAPDVFQRTEMGLWDGRPSLGGVWVAHPDVTEPERVIIRNTANGNFVIGALFRRQRDLPGPAFQVSSDAAEMLGMLAGAPAQLNVTALRREEAPEKAPEEETGTEPDAPVEAEEIAAPAGIESTALDPVAGAATAIEAAETEAAGTAGTAADAPPPQPAPAAPARPASRLDKPFIQVGIFSIEENARNTATALRQAGMVPTVLAQSSQGKSFWRVVVGPSMTDADRAAVLGKIREIGFADAYPVTN